LLLSADDQRLSEAVNKAIAAENAKHETVKDLNEAKISTLEAELDHLKQVFFFSQYHAIHVVLAYCFSK
jgi:hypothetical protein